MSTPDPSSHSYDETLTGVEHKLLMAAIKGMLIDLRDGDAKLDDPAQGLTWGAGRQVRAELLAEMLAGTLRIDGRLPRAIRLRGARITGSLNLEAASLTCPLLLQDCHIDGPVILDEATAPMIRMPGCRMTALTARQLRTTGSLALDATFTTGGVNLDGAHIGGQISLSGASLSNSGGLALSAAGLTVDGNMFCDDGFTATGDIDLTGAHIGGQLNLDGASLSNPGGRALGGSGLTVDQDMSWENGFTATGEIYLIGAHIGGQLRLRKASLVNPGGTVLVADMLTVGLDIICDDGFTATGEIGLLGAHISGQLNLGSASLSNPGGKALYGDGLTVDQDMFCDDGFTATGEIGLPGAHIGGRLVLDGASLSNPGGTALDLEAVSVSTLYLRPKQPNGVVDLTNATVKTFYDDQASWPAVLRLRGFAYDSLENDKLSTPARLRWLARHPGGYTPQLYDQLAGAYRRAGDEQAVRAVAIAKQRRRRRAYSPLSWLWYATVGYGYRPWLAGAWVIALALVGTIVFSHAYPAHMIATSPRPPSFHAAAYALDLLLPVIGLGQKSAWQPQGSAYLYWSWVLTAAGWVLTTAVVAGLAGILKRD